MTTETSELKSCPFCGGTDLVFDYPCIRCRTCAADGPFRDKKFPSETWEEQARRLWNERSDAK